MSISNIFSLVAVKTDYMFDNCHILGQIEHNLVQF